MCIHIAYSYAYCQLYAVYWVMTLKKKVYATLLGVGLSCLIFAFLPAHSLFKGKPSGALVVMGVLWSVINRHHVLKTMHGYLNFTPAFIVAARSGQLNYRNFFFKMFMSTSLQKDCLKCLPLKLWSNFSRVLGFLLSNKHSPSLSTSTHVSFHFLDLIMLHTVNSSFWSTLIIPCIPLLNWGLILMLLFCLYSKRHYSD